jgi:hypothetical protein
MEQLGKHIPAAMDMHATIEELLEMVFSMQSLLRYYNWDWSNQFNAQLKARL